MLTHISLCCLLSLCHPDDLSLHSTSKVTTKFNVQGSNTGFIILSSCRGWGRGEKQEAGCRDGEQSKGLD